MKTTKIRNILVSVRLLGKDSHTHRSQILAYLTKISKIKPFDMTTDTFFIRSEKKNADIKNQILHHIGIQDTILVCDISEDYAHYHVHDHVLLELKPISPKEQAIRELEVLSSKKNN